MKNKKVFLLTILLSFRLLAMSQEMSEDELLSKANQEYRSSNWADASIFLFGYIQKRPNIFIQDKTFEQKIKTCYNAANENLMKQVNSIPTLQAEIVRLKTEASKNNNGVGNRQQGIDITFTSPDFPDIPKKRVTDPRFIRIMAPIVGQWQAKFTSSGNTYTTKLTIVPDGETIKGDLVTPDKSKSELIGSFDGRNLVMIRNTGLATMQIYKLTRTDDTHFTGTFENMGQYPDSGTLELFR